MNGVKGYLAKVKRRKMNGRKLHRTAEESNQDRWKKKLLGKSAWYKEDDDTDIEGIHRYSK